MITKIIYTTKRTAKMILILYSWLALCLLTFDKDPFVANLIFYSGLTYGVLSFAFVEESE